MSTLTCLPSDSVAGATQTGSTQISTNAGVTFPSGISAVGSILGYSTPAQLDIARERIQQSYHNAALNNPLLQVILSDQDRFTLQAHLYDLPPELFFDCLLQLPVPQLLRLRTVCQYFKTTIDESYLLQTRIAHHALLQNQHKANIPLDNLRSHFNGNSLLVEVKNDLSVINMVLELGPVLPWIGHLTVVDCQTSALDDLLSALKKSKRLTSLCLTDCQISSSSLDALASSLNSQENSARIPIIYICNLTVKESDRRTIQFAVKDYDEKTLPYKGKDSEEETSPWDLAPKNLRYISSSEATRISSGFFEENDDGLRRLNELELQVFNTEVPANNVMEVFHSLNALIRADLISSLWHSVLTPLGPPYYQTPIPVINDQVRAYLASHPHHPAVMAAVQSSRNEFLKRHPLSLLSN